MGFRSTLYVFGAAVRWEEWEAGEVWDRDARLGRSRASVYFSDSRNATTSASSWAVMPAARPLGMRDMALLKRPAAHRPTVTAGLM